MARTTLVVQRAASTWSQIFTVTCPEFIGSKESCSQLAKDVKEFLANCPSTVEEERLAFQSIKKLLPSSCKCMDEDLLRSLSSTLTSKPRLLPRSYLSYVKRKVRSLFRKGWDSGLYESFCFTNAPGLAGTIDSSRLEGGCLGVVTDQVTLLDRTLGAEEYVTTSCQGSLMVVQSAGKPRPLTKFSSAELCLRPLHKSVYEHLSRRSKWLLRGDPTDAKLKAAGFVEGGTLVSGDYRSATDNLSLEVAGTILECILENSVSVPDSVKRHARAVLRPTLWNLDLDLEFEVTRGQMMGSYLSFPLLCVQNYLSFEFAREEAGLDMMPLLINGDDILFETWDDGFPERWMALVKTLGLEVERTKT